MDIGVDVASCKVTVTYRGEEYTMSREQFTCAMGIVSVATRTLPHEQPKAPTDVQYLTAFSLAGCGWADSLCGNANFGEEKQNRIRRRLVKLKVENA